MIVCSINVNSFRELFSAFLYSSVVLSFLSVTSISPLMIVSGVFNSWEASELNWEILSKEDSNLPSKLFTSLINWFISSSFFVVFSLADKSFAFICFNSKSIFSIG